MIFFLLIICPLYRVNENPLYHTLWGICHSGIKINRDFKITAIHHKAVKIEDVY
jgi:hypothetical protein